MTGVGGWTSNSIDLELLVEVRSGTVDMTVARLVKYPAKLGLTVMFMVAVAWKGIVPKEQTTVLLAGAQEPFVLLEETKLMPGGKVSVMVTFRAVLGA